MARVLVGIPTLNRPEWVRQAVESVRAQTVRDLRIVVSDNVSEPDAVREVDEWVRSLGDPRVTFHRQTANEGEYGQGRYFMEVCEEPYFAMLHDDDRMEPTYLEKGLARLEEDPSLLCFFANSYIFDAEGRRSPEMIRQMRRHQKRDRQPEGPMEMLGPLMRCGFTPISGTLFPTRLLRETRFAQDGTGCYPFEFDVLLRLCERGGRAYYTREELIGFRFHASSMRNYLDTWSNPQVIGDLVRLLEARRFRGADERTRRWLLATMLAFWARIRARAGDRRAARRSLARAVRLAPTCRRIWTVGLPSLLRPAGGTPGQPV